MRKLFVAPATDATEVIHSQISYHSFNQESFGENDEPSLLSRSLFLLVCGTIVPVKQRSTEHAEDLLTGRTEQFQQGNTRGSDPVHAEPAYPTEYKHGTPD